MNTAKISKAKATRTAKTVNKTTTVKTEKENATMSKKSNTTKVEKVIVNSPETEAFLAMRYDDTMANLRPVSEFTSSIEIPLDLCIVDDRYQKLRTHKKLNKLIAKWDERKLSPIVVVPRPEEKRFAIVDGQGRSRAAVQMGRTRLPAIVLLGTENFTPVERLKFEAEYFIGQDSEVEKIREVEKHLARVILGDEPAIAIENVINRHNIKLIGDDDSGRVLGSYTYAYTVASHGAECIDYVFSILEETKWLDEKDGSGHFAMRILEGVWLFYPEYRERTKELLCKELKKTTPSLVLARARAKFPEREQRAAGILYIDELVRNHFGIEDKCIRINKKGDFLKAS